MRLAQRSAAALTLVETMVGISVAVILGVVVFALLNLGMTLYTQNVSIGQTHAGGLNATEKLLLKVAAAAETPVLADEAGATQTGNGPAAGVRLYTLTSSAAYPVPTAVGATATSFNITPSANRPAPQVGDKITMADLGFSGVITASSPSGSDYTVSFASSVGSGFSPVKTSGIAIPAGSKCFLLRPSAFISVNNGLRYYPRAMSVAQDGTSAFNDQANFDTISPLLPVDPDPNSLPFQYLDTTRRSIDVNLRLRAPAYGSRITPFYTFQNMRTTVAFRSAVVR